jgi:hypothetical protein
VKFGNQNILCVSVTENPAVVDRYKRPEKTRTSTPVPGCRFRPMTATEDTSDNGVRIRDRWKLTAPPHEAVVALKAGDEIRHAGVTYRVVSLPRVHNDMSRPFKATVLADRHLG